MKEFESLISWLNDTIWSVPLIVLCLASGIYFSVAMGFPQIRLIKQTLRVLMHGETDENGITPFQSFASTVGARVGMGNIAGVATAIFFGGPGAVFWMWVLAILGASTSFIECSLAQAYKINVNGQYIGGPAYYIEKGLKCKPYAILFAISAILGPGIFMPGIQTYSVASTISASFEVDILLIVVVFVSVLAFTIFGGIKRIARFAEIVAPVMCVIYLALSLAIIVIFYDRIPEIFSLIFKSAFGAEPVYAGIIGSTISWGIRRGVFSNEAGQGSGAIVAAAASCEHPAEQGLIQSFSVLVDTLLVCTCTSLIILLSGVYDVIGTDGITYITEQTNGTEYGILWTQNALTSSLGNWSGMALSIIVVMFVFTSLIGYYYQAESNVSYVFKNNKISILVFRILFIISNFAGIVITNTSIWSLGDIGCGIMAWLNIVAVILLSKKGIKILKNYEKKLGQNGVMNFNPDEIDIEIEDSAWTKKS